jgi:hypothetical protein
MNYKHPIIPPRHGLEKITSLFGKPNETITGLTNIFEQNKNTAPRKKILQNDIIRSSDFDDIKNQIIVECNSYLDRVSRGYDSTNTYIELLSAKIFNNTFIGQLNEMLTICTTNIISQLQKQIQKHTKEDSKKCNTGLTNMDAIVLKQPASLDNPIESEYNQVVALCTANFVINLHDEIFDFFGAFVTATPQNPDCFMYHICQYRNAYVQLMNIWSLTPLERINEGTQIAILNYMINPNYKYFFLNTNVSKSGDTITSKITKILQKKLTKPNASIPTFIKQVKERNIDLFDLFDVMNDVQKFNNEKQTIRYDYLNALIAQLKIEQNEENAKALYISWFDCFHINEYNNVDKKQAKQFEEHKTRDTNAFMAFWNTDEYTNQIQLLDANIKELEPKPQSQYVIHDRYPLKGNTTSRSNTNKRVPLNVVVKKEGIVEKKEGIVKWPNKWPNLSGYP